ncbi:NAD+ synthase [Anaerolineae bacterium]|nr:NAD+ synthase [Anaerolinea sp.]MCC6974979.1 NAD+ synthase [Anaerolineae bacterium]CAG0974149.1 NAD+ synthase [Anaerolineae bacterium]
MITIVGSKDDSRVDVGELLKINTDLAQKVLVGFIRDAVTKIGFSKAVIGLSGGIDSALSAVLAVKALGAENVLCVRMPYKTSSPGSLSDAQTLIDQLGTPSLTVEITAMVDPLIAQFPDMSALRRGNIMARTRMIVLYDQSAAWRGLVIGTSNKTEAMLGYTTLFGDSAAALQPIEDLYKTQIRQLSRALNVPAEILDKPPSADLWTGQTDEGELGFTYAEVDKVLYLLIEGRYTVDEVADQGFPRDFVAKVWRQVRLNHFKRTMPNVAKLSRRSIGHDFLYMRDWSG